MLWPPDHPALTDPAIARWQDGAEAICPDAKVVKVLRYVPGRRVTTLVRLQNGQAVLKVFASPRARGNQRRLEAFTKTPAAGLVPAPLAVDASGHVGLVEFVSGSPVSDLGGRRMIEAAGLTGGVVRIIHSSQAGLDRTWSIGDELAQLRRTAGDETRSAVEAAARRWAPPQDGTAVPSHRDCYAAQAVVTAEGVRMIDLDDAAMAPPALDVGNFTAHLIRDAVTGALPSSVARSAIEAFLEGYGDAPPDLECWEKLTLARLAALAETRHRRPAEARRLLAVLG